MKFGWYKLLALLLAITIVVMAMSLSSEQTFASRVSAIGNQSVALTQDTVADVVPPPIEPSRDQTISYRSLVSNVRLRSFTLLDESKVEIHLRYLGEDSAPAVTVIIYVHPEFYYDRPCPMVEPLKPDLPVESDDIQLGIRCPPPNRPSMLIGSGVLKAGWSSESKLTLNLVGSGSAFDASLIEVMTVPFTAE